MALKDPEVFLNILEYHPESLNRPRKRSRSPSSSISTQLTPPVLAWSVVGPGMSLEEIFLALHK